MEKATWIFNEVISVIPGRYEGRINNDSLTKVISITAATTIALYSSYKIITLHKKSENKSNGFKEIPSPKGRYPYFGHILSLGNNPAEQIKKWHKETGHIIKLDMGVKTWVMVDDPILAHQIFVGQGAVSSHRPMANFSLNYYSMNGKGIVFAQPSKDWQKSRSTLLSIIAPKVVDSLFVDIIYKETSALTKRLIESSAQSKDGTDPFKHLHLNAMNMIFLSAFGKQYKGMNDPEFIELSNIINELIDSASIKNDLASYLPIFSVIDVILGKQKNMKKFYDTRRNPLFRKLMREAKEKEGNNLVKSLEEFDLEEDDKLVLLSDLVVAGTDTVSISLCWSFAILCNYPEVQKLAAEEVDKFIKSNGCVPQFKDRDQFPYIISLLKECLRFRPVVPFGVPHVASEDILVDGYLIPEGTAIVSSMHSMHMNGDFYPNPEKFVPERFANNQKTMLAAANGKLEYRDQFNFGWGRRICPGIYLAEAEFFISFVQVIARCTIEPVRDANDRYIIPDIEKTVISGLVSIPSPYKVNFVARPNALI